jgi:hypothetical protein
LPTGKTEESGKEEDGHRNLQFLAPDSVSLLAAARRHSDAPSTRDLRC